MSYISFGRLFKLAKSTNKLKVRALIAVLLLFVFGFGTDIVRLFYLQVFKGEELKTKAESQQLSDTEIAADRGIIYDCNFNVLAESASAWLVYVNPSKIKDDSQRKLISTTLAKILKLDEERIYKKISNSDYSYVKIQGKIEYTEKTLISTFIKESDLYDIVNIDPDTKRYYPYSNFASTIIGFTGSEDSGRSGLELMYNDKLSGVAGRVITAKDAWDSAMSSNYETTYDPKQGTSLVLTLDKTIQHYLEKGLSQAVIDNDAASAYGIVMEVETGAILAMATLPDYDLNLPTVITDEEVLKELSKIKDEEEYDLAYNAKIYSMWRNKAVSDTYEPGSVFKVFVAAAALEEGLVTPDYCFNCSGAIKVADNVLHCHKAGGHGNQTLAEGLMNSCNPFFVTIGQKLGTERFYKYFEAFGFTQETDVDLPGEATPVKDVTYHSLENMGISQVSSSSFGQTFQVSAMQMITGVSAIANGGSLMQPYIVKSMLDEDGNTVFEAEPTVKRSVVSQTTSEAVLAMMEKVVAEGTGKNAYVPGYRVAGKTGTSEKLTVDGEYIASFVGCAPADDPKIAVLIVIDEPQGYVHGGGAIAAPVAGRVIEETLKYMNIDPVYSAKELSQLNGVTPDVNSMSVEKAKATLKNKGFTARIIGNGDSVVSQYPLKGQNIPLDGVVILYTEKEISNTTATVPDLKGLSISSANERAVNAGFNIKISGASLDSEVVSYRQSIDAGTQTELGATITVYFKTNKGVED